MSLQGSVVVIDKELRDKTINYLSITSGTYIYNITESKNKKESKTILTTCEKPQKTKSSKEIAVIKKEHPKATPLKHYIGNNSEVFLNLPISKNFVCAGNNYHIKKDATLKKPELSEIFHFSEDIKLTLIYHLKTQYNHSNRSRIRPPPSFI
ncbi:hypothetical protein OF897_15715 [Chryseobacterium formosus]|uniref:Uncharacterized protein n=1 Tax=Chryseobacterium formosus TaxID=1537363 RepID=A0ABT3XUP6_9FLAO|nr:hypothetical protein [Chryseobacterium formosus]MCX8525366.1 hypothetical protein [Chryseobacterium formosus]